MTAEPTRLRGTVFGNGLHQFRFILLLMAAYFIGNSLNLALNVRTAKGAQTLVSSDSGQYLAIAEQFLGGNFSMDYLREVPHRQPLYPLLLAAATKLGNGNLFFLGVINAIAMSSRSVPFISAFYASFEVMPWRRFRHSASPLTRSCGEPPAPACSRNRFMLSS